MPMDLIDIVYILKPDIVPDELRYSLRSVEANLPHNRVWFVCGQPEGLEPDGRIVHKQTGNSKWAFTRSSMVEIVNNDEITDDFYLFNDDFFVMRQVTENVNYTDGTLERRINELHRDCGMSAYCRQLYFLDLEFKAKGISSNNYDVHLPMIINKEQMKDALTKSESPMFRSIYGNYNEVPFIYHADVKIYDYHTAPVTDYISTTEDTFANGNVGKLIRATFERPSRFEANG